MRIVVLDGFTLNPGDLSWSGFEAFGETTVYNRTPSDATYERAQGAEIVLTNKTVLDAEMIGRLEEMRYIGVLATGYNVVDLDAARGRDIPVTNVPEYGTKAVAQMVFALLLELANQVGHHDATVREGRWSTSKDFCYWDMPLVELDGETVGVFGFGRIGRAVADLAKAFGLRVIAYDEIRPEPMPDGVEMVDVERLFRESDVITLHCPLTPATEGLVNAARLAQMKPSAFLINTSRGPVVDEQALAAALNAGTIAGAALDVMPVEPPPPDSALLRAKNCVVTPHIAWATRAARSRLMNTAVANVEAFLQGTPQNVVNM